MTIPHTIHRTVAVLLTAISIVSGCSNPGESGARQIDSRAAEVMPFDLALTTHSFTKTDDGGTQTVVANDRRDTEQVGLIQEHLAKEAIAFTNGDYSDPARIHGMDMPGLDELKEGTARVTVSFDQLADGAKITYTTVEPALVEAIHLWFDRQSTDHN